MDYKKTRNMYSFVSAVMLVAFAVAGTGCKDLEQSVRESEMAQVEAEKNIIEKGDFVSLLYVGRFENGQIFDQSVEGKPLKFIVGLGQVIPGLDAALVGMQRDEEKTIAVPAEQAYGSRNKELVRAFPRAAIPQTVDVVLGTVLKLQTEDGRTVPGRVVQLDDEKVVVDLNHPLAGKTLVFSVKIADIA